MFLAIFKTTVKNLFRSATFWLLLAVLAISIIHSALEGFYIMDDSPEFVLGVKDYIESCENFCGAKMLNYAIPLFCIFSVVLILLRDYNDVFFEIEKAYNLKPFNYLLGRLSALAMVNLLITFFMNILGIYIYVITRGGVYNMSIFEYIGDSIIRILRLNLCISLPCILMYIGITYCVGCIFKNGIPAAIISTTYVIFWYCFRLMFSWRANPVFFDYLSPTPLKLRNYFHFYDSEWEDFLLVMFDIKLTDVALCIGLLVGTSLLFSLAAYFRIRKRTV